ncbi:MAG: VOC family protein [Myxococcales bacterium]
MPDIKKHQPGMLCWADLNTPDLKGAKRFYGKLFGWEFDDVPVEGGDAYSMALVRGRSVAALTGMPPGKGRKVPPHWNAFIAVADAKKTAAKVEPAGGKLFAPAMDVMGQGQMAILQDPSGALLSLWQPKKHPGAGVAFEPNSLVWAELMTRDAEAARAFYPKVLGWKPKDMDMGDFVYTVFNVGKKGAVGMMQMPPELAKKKMPSSWGVYFAVDDAKAALAKTKRLGGKVLAELHDAPDVGKFAPLMDPQGAVFHVLEPAM